MVDVFGWGGLDGTNFIEGWFNAWIDFRIKIESPSNGSDATGASLIEERGGRGSSGRLKGFGVVERSLPWVRSMLSSITRWAVLESLEGTLHVAFHRDINIALFEVPVKIKATVEVVVSRYYGNGIKPIPTIFSIGSVVRILPKTDNLFVL